MDQRITVSSAKDFIIMLSDLKNKNQKVSLLLDQMGIRRYEGMVKQVDESSGEISFEDGSQISVMEIIAVNGIFTSGYSEC